MVIPESIQRVAWATDIKLNEPFLTEGEWSYITRNDEYAIVYQYLDTEKDIIMPDTLGGYPVKAVSKWVFRMRRSIGTKIKRNCHSVVLPDSIFYIAERTFADLKNLETVHLPDSLVLCGEETFKNCA